MVGSYHRTEIDRAFRVLESFDEVFSADNYQSLPEATWIHTASHGKARPRTDASLDADRLLFRGNHCETGFSAAR